MRNNSGNTAASTSSRGPIRTRRITRACDRCHQTNTRCAPGPDPSRCIACDEYNEPCTYDRPQRKRGPVSGARRTSIPNSGARVKDDWAFKPVVDEEWITTLTGGYLTIVYPIFPLFHWPTFMQDIRSKKYKTDRSFYVVTMVVCAIVSSRLQHGAQLPTPLAPSSDISSSMSSEAFYLCALDAFPPTSQTIGSLNYKRAKVLLAIASLQQGDALGLHAHLGDYDTMSFTEGFYDESRWPARLNEIELQERRRVFWGAYTLETFSSTAWGGLIRHRHSQTNVQYPTEVRDDDHITLTGSQACSGEESFIHGWNFAIDLYKVIEHLVDQSRTRRMMTGPRSSCPLDVVGHGGVQEPTPRVLLDLMESKHASLPRVFRQVGAMTGDSYTDCFGFQAANITVTMQTLKMVLAGLEESSVEQRCAIAGQLLDALAAIPTSYIAAISVTMLHHLASIGHLLATIIQEPLSQWSFLQIRNVIQAMADLIAGLETALDASPDVSERLKSHVSVINDRLRNAALDAARDQVYHNALPPTLSPQTSTMNITPLSDDLQFAEPQIATASFDATQGVNLDGLGDWTFEFSPDQQIRLQNDLTVNWPFDMTAFESGTTDPPRNLPSDESGDALWLEPPFYFR